MRSDTDCHVSHSPSAITLLKGQDIYVHPWDEDDEGGQNSSSVLIPSKGLVVSFSSSASHIRVADLDRVTSRVLNHSASSGGSGSSGKVVAVCDMKDGKISVMFDDSSIAVFLVDWAKLQEERGIFIDMVGSFPSPSAPPPSGAAATEAQLAAIVASLIEPATKPPPRMQGPKHGEVDDLEHVGGNTFAGGSGGSDTAGMGGIGGPFRLQSRFGVFQVSDEIKRSVSEEAKRAAREMGEAIYNDKLRNMKMNGEDYGRYMQFKTQVAAHITRLKMVFAAAKSQEKERTFIKHQIAGDLDDNKLVDAVAGSVNIFKRRGDDDSQRSFRQTHPKAFMFSLDCSGSMYRFDRHDSRLRMVLMTATMIMESLEGMRAKVVYNIVGHSGDTEKLPLADDWKTPPQNESERFLVLKRMELHSQFCSSGDSTIASIAHCSDVLARTKDVDDRIVVCVSDANMSRYGITSKQLRQALQRNSGVKCHIVFLGSGEEGR